MAARSIMQLTFKTRSINFSGLIKLNRRIFLPTQSVEKKLVYWIELKIKKKILFPNNGKTWSIQLVCSWWWWCGYWLIFHFSWCLLLDKLFSHFIEVFQVRPNNEFENPEGHKACQGLDVFFFVSQTVNNLTHVRAFRRF